MIDELVALRYAAAIAAVDQDIVSAFGDQLKGNWLAKHYFEIVTEVVGFDTSTGHSTHPLPPRPEEGRCAPVLASGVFASPKKRARTQSSTYAASETRLVAVTVAGCHARQSSRLDAILLKAAVLEVPEGVRWVTVMDRKTKCSKKRS